MFTNVRKLLAKIEAAAVNDPSAVQVLVDQVRVELDNVEYPPMQKTAANQASEGVGQSISPEGAAYSATQGPEPSNEGGVSATDGPDPDEGGTEAIDDGHFGAPGADVATQSEQPAAEASVPA